MNEDETYEGPLMIITAPIGIPSDLKNKKTETLGQDSIKFENLNGPGIRIIKVYEQDSNQEFFSIENIPKNIILGKDSG